MAAPAGICAALILALAGPEQLRAAFDHYDFGDYAAACQMLEKERGDAGLAPGDRQKVLRYLGACHHFLGEKEAAATAFRELLAEDPHADLDPVQFPPELVAFFRDLQARQAPAPASSAPPPEVHATAPRKSRGVALLPFGAGQFQNGEPGKGAIYASLEGVALSVGIVGLALFESEKKSGSFLSGGRFDDPAQASTLQTLYLGSFITFGALWAIGIGDAFAHFDDGASVTFLPSPDGFVLGGRF
jgi:hypothetical protein